MDAYTVLWLQGMIFVYFSVLCFGVVVFIIGQLLWELSRKYKSQKEKRDYVCKR